MGRDEQPTESRSASPPSCLSAPQISLVGEIDAETVRSFLNQLCEAEKDGGDIAVEISTLGGDAELARRLVLEVGAARARIDRRVLFLGKTCVYSAGVAFMSAFPRQDRYLTNDAVLLIHCRQLEKTIEVAGPMRASLPQLEAACAQVKMGIALEEESFRRLIEGSDIGMDELTEKALHNWYIPAREALDRGLVAGIV